MIQVDRRGADVRVAQLLGDDPDLDAFASEFGRVRVAKSVRVDSLPDACDAGQSRQQRADVGREQIDGLRQRRHRSRIEAEDPLPAIGQSPNPQSQTRSAQPLGPRLQLPTVRTV